MAGTVLVFVFFGITAGGSGMFSADGISNWLVVVGPARHPRGRRQPADGRRRVRPVDRLDDRLRRHDDRDPDRVSSAGRSGWRCSSPSPARCAIGALNGWLVVRTGLPSFIVTLAFLFILRGLTIALSILFTNRTIVGGVKDPAAADWLAPLFYGTVLDGLFRWAAGAGLIDTLRRTAARSSPACPSWWSWWVVLTAIGAWILAAHPLRQLDLRRRRRRQRGPQRRRAGRPGEDRAVHGAPPSAPPSSPPAR